MYSDTVFSHQTAFFNRRQMPARRCSLANAKVLGHPL